MHEYQLLSELDRSNMPSTAATGDALENHVHEGRVYDTVLLSEMTHEEGVYYWECPCGDMFEITADDLAGGVRIAKCPSCSLKILVDGVPELLSQQQLQTSDGTS